MPFTVIMLLLVIALVTTILSLAGKCPLGVPVLLLVVIEMLDRIPKG